MKLILLLCVAATTPYLNLSDPDTPRLFTYETHMITFETEAAQTMLGAGWRDEDSDNQLILHESTPWAASVVADMRITIMEPRDFRLVLEMQPHAVEPNSKLDLPPQEVGVTWNATPLGTCRFIKEEGWTLKTFTFDVPKECQTVGPNTVTFSSRYAVSAQRLYGDGKDGRAHAFGLKSLALQNTGSKTAPAVGTPQCTFNGRTIEQQLRSRLIVPVHLPDQGGGAFEMAAIPAEGRVTLRVDSVTGPIDTRVEEVPFALDAYRGRYIEFVFEALDTTVTWKSPRIVWHDVPAKSQPATSTVETPYQNTVLIVLDAMRGDSVGANGHYREVTPHINALAQEGVLYPRAYAPIPYTYSSTWSLITGLYPFQHGAFGGETAPAAPTICDILRKAGVVTGLVSANPLASHAAGYDEFVPAYEDLASKPEGDPALVTEPAVDFLHRHADERFFLHLHYRQPHAPYRAPASDFRSLTCDPTDRLTSVTQNGEAFNQCTLVPTREQALELRARYDENVLAIDKAVAQVLGEIKECDLNKNTLVIITADHGESFGEHKNVFAHRITVYEPLVHIPLVLHGNNIQRQVPNHESVASLIDVYPTICDLMGLPAPNDVAGESLRTKAVREGQPLAFAQAAWINKGMFSPTNHWGEAFWFARYKLIRDNGNQRVELYDLERDSAERYNVAQAFPVLTDYLLAQAEAWKAKQDALRKEPVENDQEIGNTDNLRALGYL